MSLIKILPKKVINQIAAGEVIERPASVVKELIENSIDANATKIEIHFKQGGKSWIRVRDNGIGMSGEDALLAFERHSTSKIYDTRDLWQITSFGFRGEALASIASISKCTLRTRTANEAVGTEVTICGGKSQEIHPIAFNLGTEIEVSQLFYNIPARRKFIRSESLEAAHIIHLLRVYLVTHTSIGFTLLQDNREIFRVSDNDTLINRITTVFDPTWKEFLIPIEANSDNIKISGYVSNEHNSIGSRRAFITVINGRPIDSKVLNRILRQIYQAFVPAGRFPILFLFIEMNPNQLDINVHPAKKEVRFQSEIALRDLLVNAFSSLLTAKARLLQQGYNPGSVVGSKLSVWEIEAWKRRSDSFHQRIFEQKGKSSSLSQQTHLPLTPEFTCAAAAPTSPLLPLSGTNKPLNFAFPETSLANPSVYAQGAKNPEQNLISCYSREANPCPELNLKATEVQEKAPQLLQEGPSSSETSTPATAFNDASTVDNTTLGNRPDWLFLEIFGPYALFETTFGLGFLDCPAAYRSVAEKRYWNAYQQVSIPSQKLLLPQLCTWDRSLSGLLSEYIPFFEKFGFHFEPFGPTTFRLESIPAHSTPEKMIPFINDMLENFREGTLPNPTKFIAILIQETYRTPQFNHPEAVWQLIDDLITEEIPLTNRKGKRVFWELSLQELKRKFSQ